MKEQQSKVDLLIEQLLEEDLLFRDATNTAWATFTANGHKEHYMVESGAYRDRITRAYLDQYGKGISHAKLSLVTDTLKAQARFYGEEKETSLRVAEADGKIYYDLTTRDREIVEIGPDGWRIVSSENIIFQRHEHQKAQAYPARGKKLKELREYFNIDKKDALLFVVYICSLLIPTIQLPLLIFYGEAGIGKSTAARLVRDLVDPCKSNLLSLPESSEDFYLASQLYWVLAFDNMTKVSQKVSDNLCRAVTGITFATRKLYTAQEMTQVTVQRPMILTGLENVASNDDLLSRSLLFEVTGKQNNNQRPYNELLENFERDKPGFLGEILNTISKAMAIFPTVEFKNDFRMAEFAKWGYAIAEALGNGMGEEFLAAYRSNIARQATEAITCHTLAKCSYYIHGRNEPGAMDRPP